MAFMTIKSNWQDIEKVELASSGPRIRRKKTILSKSVLKTCKAYWQAYRSAKSSDADSLTLLAEKMVAKARKSATTSGDQNLAINKPYFDKLNVIVPGLSEKQQQQIREQATATTSRKRLLHAAMMRHPNWLPNVTIIGNPQVETATSSTRPAIYWVDNTIFAELFARIGLHKAGVNAMHYSDYVHEQGHTWLSSKLLQRPIFQLEQRFTDQRILSTPRRHFASMRSFAHAMRNKKPILSMNNAFLGRRHACSPIGNDMHLIQATAPLNMARRYNALVVPVTAIEVEPFRHYTVEFHSPLTIDTHLGRDDDIRRMAFLSAQRQLQAIPGNPEQWLCFVGDQISSPDAGKLHRRGM
jgi:lauroyl/myristoyl acyltransferase